MCLFVREYFIYIKIQVSLLQEVLKFKMENQNYLLMQGRDFQKQLEIIQ